MHLCHFPIQSLVVLASLLLAPAPARAIPDRPEIVRLAASVVKVHAFDDRKRTFFGTGVVVAPHRIATNCHVTRHSSQIIVVYRGETFEVAGQLADIDHDLCLLHVPSLQAPALDTLHSSRLKVGQAVWAMGFEGGAGMRFRSGFVRALHKYDGAWVIESTTAFTSGASGGALMDETGRVIGLLTYRLRGDRRSYFAVPLEWLSKSVAEVGDLPSVTPVLTGAAFWQRDTQELPFFLRAHRMVIDAQWSELFELSQAWLLSDAHNAEAWWYRGASLEMQRASHEAINAYRQALVFDANFIPALFSLGRLAAQMGDNSESERVRLALSALNRDLGQCLSRRIAPAAQQDSEENETEACSAM